MASKPIIRWEIRRTCISFPACRFVIFTPCPSTEGNEEEYTKYTYELDKDGKPTGIIAKTTSTGTVIDINGNAYNETKTDTRTININIE